MTLTLLDDIRDEAGQFLGRELTDAEWREALPQAQRKLHAIISVEGDANGERRKSYYLAQLVKEFVIIGAFLRRQRESAERNDPYEIAQTYA